MLEKLRENAEKALQSPHGSSVANRALELLGTELGMFRNDGPVKPPTLEDLSTEDLMKLLAQTPVDADPTEPPSGVTQ